MEKVKTRRMMLAQVIAFAIVLASCGGNDKQRAATLQYWNQYKAVLERTPKKLGEKPSMTDVARSYSAVADELQRLPAESVDIELLAAINAQIRSFEELGVVYGRLAQRYEDMGYSLSKAAESFLRGLSGDPSGTTGDEINAISNEKAEIELIKKNLRANSADLREITQKLSRRYGTEFVMPE